MRRRAVSKNPSGKSGFLQAEVSTQQVVRPRRLISDQGSLVAPEWSGHGVEPGFPGRPLSSRRDNFLPRGWKRAPACARNKRCNRREAAHAFQRLFLWPSLRPSPPLPRDHVLPGFGAVAIPDGGAVPPPPGPAETAGKLRRAATTPVPFW